MKKLYPLRFTDNAEETEITYSLSCTENSFIANGFLAGNTLDDIIETYLGSLLGEEIFKGFHGVFPIEVKIREFSKVSPVTVSPDDIIARERFMCWGKDRFWYVLDRKKNAAIYMGFKKTLSAQELYGLFKAGKMKDAMNEIDPEEGETFYIRPGVPFCAKGVTVIEVSQNSPVEFNIENYDEFAETLDFVDMKSYIPEYQLPEECTYRAERVVLKSDQIVSPEESDSFTIYVCIGGKSHIKTSDGEDMPLQKNDIVLIPQEAEEFHFTPDGKEKDQKAQFLRISMGQVEEEPNSYITDKQEDNSCNCHHCGEDAEHNHNHDHNHNHTDR